MTVTKNTLGRWGKEFGKESLVHKIFRRDLSLSTTRPQQLPPCNMRTTDTARRGRTKRGTKSPWKGAFCFACLIGIQWGRITCFQLDGQYVSLYL